MNMLTLFVVELTSAQRIDVCIHIFFVRRRFFYRISITIINKTDYTPNISYYAAYLYYVICMNHSPEVVISYILYLNETTIFLVYFTFLPTGTYRRQRHCRYHHGLYIYIYFFLIYFKKHASLINPITIRYFSLVIRTPTSRFPIIGRT